MPPRALPVLLCVVLWIWRARSAIACPSGQVLHYDDNYGVEWCCERLHCPKGSVGHICEPGQPNTTECRACPEGEFMPSRTFSERVNKCRPKRLCATGQEIEEGSAMVDRKCGKCNVSAGYYPHYTDQHGGEVSFVCNRKKCGAGTELYFEDSNKSNVEAPCATCRPGTYKPQADFFPCKGWTHCERYGLINANNGSALNDTTCLLKNATASPATDTTTDLMPPVGESKGQDKDNVLLIALPVGLVCAVILVVIALLIVIRHRQENARSRESLSGVEKQHLKRSNSTSDSEDSLPSKQNEKNLRKLKGGKVPVVPPLDIKKANSGETSVLTNSILNTPDSGIAEIYAAFTPTFRQGLNSPRPFTLAHDVVPDSVPELEEEPPGVNPSSPGRLGGSRSGSSSNGGPSPADSSESGHIPNGFPPRDRHRSGSADLPDVHNNSAGREPVVNQYYIKHLIYQNGQNCQVNNISQPHEEEEDYLRDSGDRDSSFSSEQGNYSYEDDGSTRV